MNSAITAGIVGMILLICCSFCMGQSLVSAYILYFKLQNYLGLDIGEDE